MDKIRILLADDQTLMRDGLKTILEIQDDIEVVALAENGGQAYELALKHRPDVVLMDIRMPGMDGVAGARLIKNSLPGTRVIMLTTFDDDEYIVQALSSGASGYLLKDMTGDKLVSAIRDAMTGNLLMPAVVAAKLASKLNGLPASQKKAAGLEEILSEREIEIARLLADGFTNRQIAAYLNISEGTAKNYISSIYGKIDINDRTKAVIYLSGYFRQDDE